MLEYYKGILILTTNRVGAFDDAFHSRIHLSLYYPTLDRGKTIEIFEGHFRRIKERNEERVQKGEAPIKIEKTLIRKYWNLNYKILKWNGRQIRNAFQMAMALAEYDARDSPADKPPLITANHFEIIANASADFARYVTEVQGAEAGIVAQRDMIRLDHNPKVSSKLKKLKDMDSDSSEPDVSKSQSSSSENSGDSDDEEGKKSKKKNKGKSKENRKGKTAKKGKKSCSASGKRGGRGSKDSSSDEEG